MATEESIYDMVITELLERQSLVRDELRERFKKTKPFRQEPVSNKEALVQYDEMTPETEAMLRQSFGNEVVDSYVAKMVKIKGRYK